jgi:hypothetical protein
VVLERLGPSLEYETSQAPAEVKRNKMGKLQAATNRAKRALEIHLVLWGQACTPCNILVLVLILVLAEAT